MDSIELRLPKSLELAGMDEAQSDIKDMPGKAQGAFMWTNGPYVLEPAGKLKVAVRVKALTPGSDKITFRVTTSNKYENAPEIAVTVK